MVGVRPQRLWNWFVLCLLLSTVLVACVRPLSGGEEAPPADTTTETDGGDVAAEAGSETVGVEGESGETTGETTTEAELPEVVIEGSGGESSEAPAAEGEASSEGETTDAVAENTEGETTAEGTATEGEATDAAAEGEASGEGETTDAAAENTEGEATGETAVTEESGSEATVEESTPAQATETTTTLTSGTHTVAEGENLYRIGLKYGISWVQLANVNNISDPNRLTVGQVLTIPSPDSSEPPEPTPSPMTETTYTVQAGDNLFRIGLAYGISWVQIAEANGIINPNHITVGQVLKIPIDAPGPAPEFTHTVSQGETLFRISLQYGVTWMAIAEANNLAAPYIIYTGQTLVIPGSE